MQGKDPEIYKMLRYIQYDYDTGSQMSIDSRVNIRFHQFEKEVIKYAYEHEDDLKLSVFYPSDLPDIPLALILFFTYELFDNNKRVIVIGDYVSPYREIYYNTLINGTSLCDLHGLAMIGIGGMVRPVRKYKINLQTNFDRVYISGNWQFFPEGDSVGAVIIVSPKNNFVEKMGNAIAWITKNNIKNIVVIDASQKLDHAKYFISNNFEFLGWSKQDIEKILADNSNKIESPYSRSLKDLANYLKEPVISHTLLEFPSLDKQLNELRENVTKSKTLDRANPFDKKAQIYFIQMRRRIETLISTLAIDEKYYKNTPFSFTAKTLMEQIKSLTFSDWTSSLLIAKNTSDLLYRQLFLFNEQTPKFISLISKIEWAIGENKKLLIICCGNREHRDSFIESLSMLKQPITIKTLKDKNIEIVTVKDAESIEGNFDLCVFTSYPPMNLNHILFHYFAPKTEVLIYQSEMETLSYLENEYRYMQNEFIKQLSSASKELRMKRKHLDAITVKLEEKGATPSLSIEELLNNIDDKQNAEPIELTRLVNDYRLNDDSVMEQGFEVELEDSNNGVREIIFLKKHSYVQVFKEPDNVKHIKSSALRQGNVVVLINNSLKNSLNDEILRKAAMDPNMILLVHTARLWVDAINAGMKENKDDVNSLLSKLIKEGSKITSPTAIYFWKKGWVIGPKNEADIEAVARLYENEELLKKAKDVYSAIRKIRSIRKKLVSRLKLIIFNRDYTDKVFSEALSEEWQIFPEDFVDSIRFFRVVSIKESNNIPIYKFGKEIGKHGHWKY
jgi:hypothetical protein